MSYYICQENIAQPPRRQRIRNEFREVRDEIEIIAGERPPPENWAFPVRLIQLQIATFIILITNNIWNVYLEFCTPYVKTETR